MEVAAGGHAAGGADRERLGRATREWDSSSDGDVRGRASCSGARQMAFLERWAGDWSWRRLDEVGGIADRSSPTSRRCRGARAPMTSRRSCRFSRRAGTRAGEAPVQDHDSNGWPQSPRLAALRLMRKAGALHIAGDQHLGSTIQYGIDTFRDGPVAICVPSVANFWPRRWFPDTEGANREARRAAQHRRLPRRVRQQDDGARGVEPVQARHRAGRHQRPRAGLRHHHVRPRRRGRSTMANWPRWVDPAAPGAKPYPGWPITVRQEARQP